MDATILHITNGDVAAQGLQRGGLPGAILSWRDVLHEGPVPERLTLRELSQIRARFIADTCGGHYNDVLALFMHRDMTVSNISIYSEITLWFEHDLYDQLQLIQLLEWFARHDLSNTRLTLVAIDSFPGVEHFLGLGQLNPEQLSSLYPTRREVTRAELLLGRAAWEAFRAPEPTAITRLLSEDTGALPFLAAALRRHLQQFPSALNGLARTEQQILANAAANISTPVELYLADQQQEDRPYLGDRWFWTYLTGLCLCREPLIRRLDHLPFLAPANATEYEPFVGPHFSDQGYENGVESASELHFKQQQLVLTEAGQAVLRGQADQVVLNGINRWLGGTRLHGRGKGWRWDESEQKLVQL